MEQETDVGEPGEWAQRSGELGFCWRGGEFRRALGKFAKLKWVREAGVLRAEGQRKLRWGIKETLPCWSAEPQMGGLRRPSAGHILAGFVETALGTVSPLMLR